MTPSNDSKPFVTKGFRLQWEPAQDAHVLLYPEGMVKLNRSAGEILSRCTGDSTFQQIVAELERRFERDGLQNDVGGFLSLAKAQGWVEWQREDVGPDSPEQPDAVSRAPTVG